MYPSYCRVRYCRYSNTHVTKGHKCGKCGKNGHGDAECGKINNIQLLKNYFSETLPTELYCTVENCKKKMYHTIDAHHCKQCQKREPHIKENCPLNPEHDKKNTITYNMQCPLCRQQNTVVNPRKVLGLTDECCICYENKVEVLFPICYHICICLNCLDKSQK